MSNSNLPLIPETNISQLNANHCQHHDHPEVNQSTLVKTTTITPKSSTPSSSSCSLNNNNNNGQSSITMKTNIFPASPLTSETIEINQLRENLRNITSPTIDFSSLTSSSSAYSTLRRKIIKPDIDLNLLGSSSDDDDDDDGDDNDKNGGHIDDDNHERDTHSDTNSGPRTSSLSRTSQCFSDSNEDESVFSSDSGPFSIDVRPSTRCKQSQQSPSSFNQRLSKCETPIVHEAVEVNDYDLSLSFRELRHIRKALARAELDSIGLTRRSKEDIRKGKICSACLKTRFRIFGCWPVRCRLCERPVCGRCSTVVLMSNRRYNRIPVKLLVPKNNLFNVNHNNNNNSGGNQLRCSNQPINRSHSDTTNTASSSSSHLTGDSMVCTEEEEEDEEEEKIVKKRNSLERKRKNYNTYTVDSSNDILDSPFSLSEKISFAWSWKGSSNNKSLDDGTSQMMLKLCKECELFIVTVMAMD